MVDRLRSQFDRSGGRAKPLTKFLFCFRMGLVAAEKMRAMTDLSLQLSR